MSSFTSFGEALKAWRHRRDLSQLDLALDADVSARHISYLETGRARPSREMVLQLSEALGLPLRARNELLDQAGFAAVFEQTPLDQPALAAVRTVLARMLANHMPLPALICDRHWTLVDANPAAQALLSALHQGRGPPNLIRMILAEGPARTIIVNWSEVVRDLAHRLRLELMRSSGDPVLRELLEAARDARPGAEEIGEATARPFVPVHLRVGELELSLLSVLAEFGTPRDITIADLRIELFFAADAATERYFTDTTS
jgi:transcriptional regulator with XRE-family HTH domain